MPTPDISAAVSAITRAEFDQLAHQGLAGEAPALDAVSVSEQWQSEFPDWRGRYWAYTEAEAGVLRLGPLNLTRARRQAAA
ncbi:hypothetical protein [Nocardia jiangxiensis]|uniref:hypothetical protein n=1 Tax=Nocardia jiangxiensis TaxID=282685 RepID=UPI0002D2DE25|nr:hypothetical protein [Nocardia jiangxiensis]